jgi:thymidylate synthase (FAD)
MKLIKPYYQIITPIDGKEILISIEKIGRTCYKSEDKITDVSPKAFIEKLIKSGHLSVIEHVSFSVRFICDRGISHKQFVA